MKYTTPEMEIVRFEAMDVIVASAQGPVTCDEDGMTCDFDLGDV